VSTVLLVPWVAYASVVLLAARRSRAFGGFALVVMGFPTLAALALREAMGPWSSTAIVLHLTACIHFMALVTVPRMRPAWFRFGVSVPGLWFTACSFLAFPWAVVALSGGTPHGWWLPFVVGLGGLWESLHAKEEEVDVVLDPRDAGPLRRHPEAVGRAAVAAAADRLEPRPLEIVQIADPHLGPFMSIQRLRRICRRAVERNPDLILITGDLMTMESHDVEVVSAALEPLAASSAPVFACHGNHDHEARQIVAEAYRRHGVTLLVDEEAVVETVAGRVQILGADFTWRGRDRHLRDLSDRFPRRGDALRLWLLHDPGAFRHIPEGQADLVLSGHTHGGQVGLVSLGMRGTFLSLVSKIPDHGLWARGPDRLYVHRAQGHYGFPIRLGVPPEQSLVRVHRMGTEPLSRPSGP
jgi:uncharacterized protein